VQVSSLQTLSEVTFNHRTNGGSERAQSSAADEARQMLLNRRRLGRQQ
jgi:hypothetical protein